MSEFMCEKCNGPIPAGQPIVFDRQTGKASHFLTDHCRAQQQTMNNLIGQSGQEIKCLCGIVSVCPVHGFARDGK